MSNIYYAKFNVNEDIFNIYKNYKKLSDILEYVLLNMDSKNSYRDEKEKTKYKFYRLNKDFEKNIIFGWLLKIYDEENFNIFDESYEKLDDVTLKKVSYAIPFSFNLNTEIIAFVPKQKFGYKNFIDKFKLLFENNLPEVGYVNITMLVDKKSVEQKFIDIDKMNLFTAVIVPPNGSEDILDEMDEIIDELQEANVKEYRHELKSDVRDPINKNSKIVRVLREVSEYGAGYFYAKGKNKLNNWVEINTKKDKKLFLKDSIDIQKRDSPIEVMYQSEKLDN
ncbi:hypothetical protein WER97_07765 [Staphylococcus felis]|uniref:Uncharacterized protein n=2 Tax=Staphylococcus felis TaxID=46127 RepID=A0ABS0QS56_9STAP|nr:hypothetical protein [Staphylococcus felis]MBH9582054.1 hypothetical protein [Staphylococcus felis]